MSGTLQDVFDSLPEMKHQVDISNGFEIGGYHIGVKMNDEARKRCQARDVYGSCSLMLEEMLLDASQTSNKLSNTFIHETVHLVSDLFALGLEEEAVIALGNGMHQVMESLGVRFGAGYEKLDTVEILGGE